MITPSAGMEPAGACHAKKCARVFAVRRWKPDADWIAPTGYASAAPICACAIAQPPCDRPQVLPAYGLQDSRNESRDPKTKSNPNTMCLPITPGGNRGTGHFYLAKNRTFLLCVDTNWCFRYAIRPTPEDRYPECAEGLSCFVVLSRLPPALRERGFAHREKIDIPRGCHESGGSQF